MAMGDFLDSWKMAEEDVRAKVQVEGVKVVVDPATFVTFQCLPNLFFFLVGKETSLGYCLCGPLQPHMTENMLAP